jgi:hypothetical protein
LRDAVTRFAMIDAKTMADAPDRPLELADAKAMLQRVHGTDYGITKVEAINRFHDALLVADRIRDRRVFLVGESVRVHYPAGGVGMNFCIQDGFNLGWKLAAAVAGRAPAWLLGTYETERWPEINALIDDVRRQCAIQFNFDEEHIALKRFIERELLPMPEVNRRICENLAGLSAHYPAPEGSPAIVGRRLSNLRITSGSGEANVFELLRSQEFLLLDLTGPAPLASVAPGVRVKIAAADASDQSLLAGLAALLVRPDGHVAWAGKQSLEAYRPEAEIREWLNIPAQTPVFRSEHQPTSHPFP